MPDGFSGFLFALVVLLVNHILMVGHCGIKFDPNKTRADIPETCCR